MVYRKSNDPTAPEGAMKKKPKLPNPFAIRLPAEMMEKLRAAAQKDGRSVANYIRLVLSEKL